MRRSILSSLRAHLGRLIAACLAIVLGVGFGSLAMTVHASASHGIDETIGRQLAGVDAVVTPQNASITAKDVAAVRKVPQADSVIATTSAYMRVTWAGKVRPGSLGIQARYDTSRIAGPSAIQGRLPDSTLEIALPAKVAEKNKVALGSKLRLNTYNDKSFTVTVVGLLDDAATVGPSDAVATAQTVKIFEPEGSIGDLRIAAKPGVSQDALAAAVTDAVGNNLQVYTGKAYIAHEVEGYTHGIDVLGGVFGMFAVIALFVACLVIGNTFTIVIAQRTREMALLRCVGASRRQVFSSVLAEASVVGVVASAVGVVFGVALSALGLALTREFDWGIPKIDLHLDLASIFLPLLLGTIATILAAVVPARRATRVAPLAALRPDTAPVAGSKAGVLRLILGFLLIAGGGLLLAVSANSHQVLVGVAGGVVSFIGLLAIGSLLVPALVRLLGALPTRGGGVPARIAVGNAVRNPKRTAATTSALLIGVTLISLTCVGIASVRKTFDTTMDDQYPVDLMVMSYNEKMPAGGQQQLHDIKGITQVVPIRTVAMKAGQEEINVTGIDPATGAAVIHNPDLVTKLKTPGTALLDYSTMKMLKLEDGSTLTLVSGKQKLTLKAYVATGLDPVTVSLPDLEKVAPQSAITGYWLASDPKADGSDVLDAVQESLPTVKELSVSGGLAERTMYTKIFDVLLIVGIGLLGVSVLIALVGVGNTLSLSVLERTRENALLRALGLTRRQLRGMLAIESLLMALVAAGLGIGLGLLYGWTGTMALMGGQTATGDVEYALPVGMLVTIALVAAVAGLLASVLPARRAAKVAPAGALATE
ncbi:putative ABC transport system permease protein [Kribbella voronezhensis]|uniref:Putative ABC transport system permease protein n=1 Tax=Kribbella voronezhensis TaxID=2512212 RepID=A0A4R7TGH4_9ACTN|nr:FtsX-like permease family protein [Kribbella voronezhensis]TDU91330.1 putative ABC transport system permease protein [Kribbella voronezhensis]